jgi:hypothetical protein
MAGEYGPEEWAAMEAAIALARADSSREADWAKWYFEICAEERQKEDPDERFLFPPISEYDEVFDRHTRKGSKLGRDMGHFVKHSSRVTDETDLGKGYKRRILLHEDFTDDPDEIEEAVANLENGVHDERPERNQSLSECGQ